MRGAQDDSNSYKDDRIQPSTTGTETIYSPSRDSFGADPSRPFDDSRISLPFDESIGKRARSGQKQTQETGKSEFKAGRAVDSHEAGEATPKRSTSGQKHDQPTDQSPVKASHAVSSQEAGKPVLEVSRDFRPYLLRYTADGKNFATVEEAEEYVRQNTENNPIILWFLGFLSSLGICVFYLVSFESLLCFGLTVGLTVFWYNFSEHKREWTASAMDWVILGFAIVTPLVTSIGQAFTRRERALYDIVKIRSFCYHLYLAHATWDWDENGGRAGCEDIDWLDHTDQVLDEIIGFGDELVRFLTMPSASKSRHKMTPCGKEEAARTIEVLYLLCESLYTERLTRLSALGERLRKAGLPSGEVSRIKQYERYVAENIQDLRTIKQYRTSQALRTFGRIFSLVMPPFFAPTYAEIGRDLDSFGYGIAYGLIVAFCLTSLFEAAQFLEDPFVSEISLDGIDVREEFEVLQWRQLVNTRRMLYPDAPPYPKESRPAIPPGTPLAAKSPDRKPSTKFTDTGMGAGDNQTEELQLPKARRGSQSERISSYDFMGPERNKINRRHAAQKWLKREN